MAKAKKRAARKPLTEEQKLKLKENLAKATEKRRANIAAKKAAAEATLPTPLVVDENELPDDPTIVSVPAGVHVAPLATHEIPEDAKPEAPTSEVDELRAMVSALTSTVEELVATNATLSTEDKLLEMARLLGNNGNNANAGIGANGVQGIQFKFPIDEGHYPNPTERLYDEPTLRRFALRENFYFQWEVTGETYEKHNITYSEPRFIVTLYRFMYDDNGEPNGKMFMVGRMMLHEDELFTRLAAKRMGLVEGENFETFQDLMNEVRFIRISEWLRASFRPVHVQSYQKKSTTMLIDGKQVEVFDTEDRVAAAQAEAESAAIKAQVKVPTIPNY